MSNTNSSNVGSRTASGGLSNNSISSSVTSASTAPYDLPQRVATSNYSTNTVRRLRARHLHPTHPYCTDFDKNFQDWVYDWDIPDCETATKLLEFIRTEYNLPIAKDTPVQEVGCGVFNKVFALRTRQNDKVASQPKSASSHALPEIVVLRIGWPLAPKVKLESDVATMTFARREAGLPVPRVFWYDSSAENPWQLEWAVLEYVDGKVFQDADSLWNNPTCATMKKVAELIAGHCNRLTTCRNFDKIGSLYFNDWEWNTRGPMGIDGYVVGPSAEVDFWGSPRAYYQDLDRGPWDSVEGYMSALVDVHIRDAENKDIPDGSFEFDATCPCTTKQESPYTCSHVRRLRSKYLKLAKEIKNKLIPAAARKAEAAARADGYTGSLGGCGAVLWHHDLHYGNIFLSQHASGALTDPERDGPAIAAFLDFEQIKIAPRFLHHPVPKVAYSFTFNKDDRGGYPAGDRMYGPSLEDLFGGHAKRISMCPKAFDPPVESMKPWAVAMLNITVMIIRLVSMDPGDIEWWIGALEYLGFPQTDDYGFSGVADDDDDASGRSDDDHAGSADGGSGGNLSQGRKDDRGKPVDKDQLQGKPLDDPKGKYIPPHKRRGRASHATWEDSRAQKPFCAKAFLALPIPPQSPTAPTPTYQPAGPPFEAKSALKKKAAHLPNIIIPPLEPVMTTVELTPSPGTPGPIQTQYGAGQPMQIPLQDLLVARNQAAQAPVVAPSSWLPPFLSMFICCH